MSLRLYLRRDKVRHYNSLSVPGGAILRMYPLLTRLPRRGTGRLERSTHRNRHLFDLNVVKPPAVIITASMLDNAYASPQRGRARRFLDLLLFETPVSANRALDHRFLCIMLERHFSRSDGRRLHIPRGLSKAEPESNDPGLSGYTCWLREGAA
jgi:hypothetical protein